MISPAPPAVDWTFEPTGENHNDFDMYVHEPQTNNGRQQECFTARGFTWAGGCDQLGFMGATELAMVKCPLAHESDLFQGEEDMKDNMEQREADEWEAYDGEAFEIAEEVELLAWYQLRTGLHLHREEIYRAYEARGALRVVMQEEDDALESEQETEEDTRNKEALRQHLREEEERDDEEIRQKQQRQQQMRRHDDYKQMFYRGNLSLLAEWQRRQAPRVRLHSGDLEMA